MNLIERLIALPSDVTPDEAVKRIGRRGWINLSAMSSQDFDRLDKKDIIVAASGRRDFFKILLDTDTKPYIFNADGWRNSTTTDFWLCLKSEYDGEIPADLALYAGRDAPV